MKKLKIERGGPFSNGMSFEWFREYFCERCKKHKEDETTGYCAFVEDGGCPIENACEDARFNLELFPVDKIVSLSESGKIKYWHVCTDFQAKTEELQEKYDRLYWSESEGE